MIRIISLFLITLVLLQSCTTISYKQEDWTSDKSRGLHIYENIRKDESYSLWSYLTFTGVPLAAFAGGGQAYYDIATKNGTPADSARDIRNLIWAAGLFAAGSGVYYLIKQDSTLPKGQSIYGASAIEEWFVSEFDTDDYILLGFSGSTAYVLEADKENTFGARSNSELKSIYSAMKNYVVDKNILSKIAKNSVKTIPKSEHFVAYYTLDKKYPIFLTDCIDEIYEIKDLYIYASEIEVLKDDKVKSELRSKTAKRIFDRIQESYSNEIAYYDEWLNFYSKYEDGEILTLKGEMVKKYQDIVLSKYEVLAKLLKELEEEQDLEVKKIKTTLTSYKNDIDLELKKILVKMDNFIKHAQSKDSGKQLTLEIQEFEENLTRKLKSSEELKANISDVSDKMVYFDFNKENINYTVLELLNSKKEDIENTLLKIKTKTNKAKQEVEVETQVFKVFVSEIHDKLNTKEEELKHEGELQRERLKEQRRKEQKALIAKLEQGDCIQFGTFTDGFKMTAFFSTAEVMEELASDEENENVYNWHSVQFIRLKGNMMTVRFMRNMLGYEAGQEIFLNINNSKLRSCR